MVGVLFDHPNNGYISDALTHGYNLNSQLVTGDARARRESWSGEIRRALMSYV